MLRYAKAALPLDVSYTLFCCVGRELHRRFVLFATGLELHAFCCVGRELHAFCCVGRELHAFCCVGRELHAFCCVGRTVSYTLFAVSPFQLDTSYTPFAVSDSSCMLFAVLDVIELYSFCCCPFPTGHELHAFCCVGRELHAFCTECPSSLQLDMSYTVFAVSPFQLDVI